VDERLVEDGIRGIAMIRYEYDDQGRRIEVSYYGADGRLKSSRAGIAVCRWIFDETGKHVETVYLDDEEGIWTQDGRDSERNEEVV